MGALRRYNPKRRDLRNDYPSGYRPAKRRSEKLTVTQSAKLYGDIYSPQSRIPKTLISDDHYSVTSEIRIALTDRGNTIGFNSIDPDTGKLFTVSFPYRQFQLFLAAMSKPQISEFMDNTGQALRDIRHLADIELAKRMTRIMNQ